jgi:hypothetical protein
MPFLVVPGAWLFLDLGSIDDTGLYGDRWRSKRRRDMERSRGWGCWDNETMKRSKGAGKPGCLEHGVYMI